MKMVELSSRITNPDKKIFENHTKKDLLDYYINIAGRMLPFLKNRPLTLYRFPAGVDKKGFYQKNMPSHFPGWIDHRVVKKKDGDVDYITCNKKQSLIYIASLVAEFHTWTSTVKNIHHPDRLIFDLDPSKKDIALLKSTAQKLGRLLKNIGTYPLLMTTGKKGYHIFVPIKPEYTNEKIRELALKIAKVIEEDNPDDITTQLQKSKRGSKTFIDINRNSPHQTAISPYSVRATSNATVAAPISWKELDKIDPDTYNISNIKDNPWKEKEVSLKKIIRNLKR